MASESSTVIPAVGTWTELAAASGANRVVTIELLGGKQVHFAMDDAAANLPAGFVGQRYVTPASPVATVLVQDGEKLFARTDYPNCHITVSEYDEA